MAKRLDQYYKFSSMDSRLRGNDVKSSGKAHLPGSSIMNNKLKNFFRDLLPERYQVPVKYHYNRIKSRLEPELDLLRFLVKENDLAIDVGGNRGIYACRFPALLLYEQLSSEPL